MTTNVIVTGLPRSGSATVAALIDSLPNAVSLNAPPWQAAIARHVPDSLSYCQWLVGDFTWTRQLLLNKEPVMDYRAADGSPLLDGLFDARRKTQSGQTEIPEAVAFTREGLTGDFILAMRHHTLFTSVLPTLVKFKHFKIIAVIRHPLDVLHSWRKLPDPLIRRGNPPGIARFWPELLAIAEAKIENADRLVQLYDAYIQRYHELREHIHIVKYEEVVENPAIISHLFGIGTVSPAARFIETRPTVLSTAQTPIFRDRLHKYGVFTKLYYPDV